MPKVPIYQRRVQEAGLPAPQVTTTAPAAAFGATTAIPKAIQNYADGLNDILAVEKKNADQLRVLEANKRLADFDNNLLYNEVDGAMTIKGKDTFGLHESVADSYQKFIDSELEGFANEEQKNAYRKIAYSRQAGTNKLIQRHVFAERVKYDQELTDSFIYNEHQNAVRNYQDPDLSAVHIASQVDEIIKYGNRNGIPLATIKEQVTKQVSLNHKDIISRYLSNDNDRGASAYYKQVKGVMTAEHKDTIDKALIEGSARGESQRRADQIVQRVENLTEAYEEVRKIRDPIIRDKTNERVRQYFSDKEKAIKLSSENAYRNAANLVDDNPGRPLDEVIPSDVWNVLTPEHKNTLKKRYANPINDDKAWTEYYTMSPSDRASMTQEEFELKYYYKLDRSHKRLAEDLRQKAIKGDPSIHTKTRNFNQMVKDAFLNANHLGKGKATISKLNKTQRQNFSKLSRMAEEQLIELEREKGKPATKEEQRKVIDDVFMTTVFVEGWFSGREVPIRLVEQDDIGETYVPIEKISKEHGDNIKALLEANNIRPENNKDLIQQIYAAALFKDNERINKLLAENRPETTVRSRREVLAAPMLRPTVPARTGILETVREQ